MRRERAIRVVLVFCLVGSFNCQLAHSSRLSIGLATDVPGCWQLAGLPFSWEKHLNNESLLGA